MTVARPPALALALALSAAGCTSVLAPERALEPSAAGTTIDVTIEDQSFTREVRLHWPAGARTAVPLVVVLHGGGSSAEGMEEVTGMSRIADREGFAVAYPQGLGAPGGVARAWNAGDCCGRPHLLGVSDVAFVRRLVLDLEARLPIDRRRVFVVGYSNGAMLAYRVGSEVSDLVAAIAAYAGSMSAKDPLAAPRFDLVPPPVPIGVITIQGTDDPRMAIRGTEKRQGVDVSFAHAVRFWAVAARCAGRPSRRFDRGGAVWIDEYPGCAAPIAEITLEGWDHEWPGPENTLELPRTARLYGYDLAEAIWAFFRAVPVGPVRVSAP